MGKLIGKVVATGFLVALCAAYVAAYSIDEEQVDSQKIYWGLPDSFEKPGEVRYQEVVVETPEYKKLKKDKIERGTGRYWILISQASDRAVKTIAQVGQESEYDLIAAEGYLGSLEPAIPAEDITDLVLETMKQNQKKASNR
ncbi:MAG: hypothetical protein R6V12_14285 [Candidatus Hydrogenedentota bacterium]